MSIRQLAQKIQNIQTPVGWRCDLSVKHFVEYIRMTCFLRFFVVVVVVAVAVGCISAKVLIGKKYFHSDVREKYS